MFNVNLFKKFRRGPQVITVKDAAFISARTGLQSGDVVVDAGAGSGWLACYLGSIAAPSGKVFSYEYRPEFAEIAAFNVKKSSLESVVEIKNKSVFDGIDEKNVDLVTLDLANSEKALCHAFAALKPLGFCVGYHPNVEQVKTFVLQANSLGFIHLDSIEVIVRELLVRDYGCRPATKGITHTAYLTFLRKPFEIDLARLAPKQPAQNTASVSSESSKPTQNPELLDSSLEASQEDGAEGEKTGF